MDDISITYSTVHAEVQLLISKGKTFPLTMAISETNIQTGQNVSHANLTACKILFKRIPYHENL